jgi:hypothetical protein
MAANEERMKILQMLEDGKITPEEATTLLRALGKGSGIGPTTVGADGESRYLRIRVTDLDSGQGKINVTIPFGLVSAGLRIADRFTPEFEDVDMQELEEAILSGASGKIIEVVDAEDNERVEIYVE